MCGSLILKQRYLASCLWVFPKLNKVFFILVNCLSLSPFFSIPFQGKPQLLKTVPEEVHHQLNGEDVLIAQDRNLGSGTRF